MRNIVKKVKECCRYEFTFKEMNNRFHGFWNEFKDMEAVYIFVDDNYKPLYIGHSRNLASRLISHNSDICSKMYNRVYKYLWIISDNGDYDWNYIEKTLIKKLQPELNKHYK